MNRYPNLKTGAQIRAARALAGWTQRELGAALGVNERAIRFWERKRDRPPASYRKIVRIERAFELAGVIFIAEPAIGVGLAEVPAEVGRPELKDEAACQDQVGDTRTRATGERSFV